MTDIRFTPSTDRVHLTAVIDAGQRQQLIEIARRDDRSLSAVVRLALAAHIQRCFQPSPTNEGETP